MSQPQPNANDRFPPGWDEPRIRQVIAHYDSQSDDEAIAEDEAAFEDSTHTVMVVPSELVPAVRAMLSEARPPGYDAH